MKPHSERKNIVGNKLVALLPLGAEGLMFPPSLKRSQRLAHSDIGPILSNRYAPNVPSGTAPADRMGFLRLPVV